MQAIEAAKLGNLTIPRIINGMWQVAGGHGVIDRDAAIVEMSQYHDTGLVAWDMADIYGPAEEFYGEFRNTLDEKQKKRSIAFTKFVPNPGVMSKSIVEHYIDQSISRMNVDSLDLLQFHWWDYSDEHYLQALDNLQELTDAGKISNLALTNFDTKRMEIITDRGIKLASNQVQHSMLDYRPQKKMAQFCQKHGIALVCYGTILGGFFSEKYLGAPEPDRSQLDTYSLSKYKNTIDAWGGWALFQELLSCVSKIAGKHECSIANVAVRYVLDSPAVAGCIVGSRLGIANHLQDNLKVFSLKLDSDDYSAISEVTRKANDLFDVIGDCGDEYR